MRTTREYLILYEEIRKAVADSFLADILYCELKVANDRESCRQWLQRQFQSLKMYAMAEQCSASQVDTYARIFAKELLWKAAHGEYPHFAHHLFLKEDDRLDYFKALIICRTYA